MPDFIEDMKISYNGRNIYAIKEEVVVLGHTIEKNFVTDLCSGLMPAYIRLLVPTKGKAILAYIVYDYMLESGVNLEQASEIFYQNLRRCEVTSDKGPKRLLEKIVKHGIKTRFEQLDNCYVLRNI